MPKAPPVEATKRQKTPKWKQECIDSYYNCKQEGWIGDCFACFELCQGQHQWPEDKCYSRWKRR